jgi:Zn-dependent protease with chaperone function
LDVQPPDIKSFGFLLNVDQGTVSSSDQPTEKVLSKIQKEIAAAKIRRAELTWRYFLGLLITVVAVALLPLLFLGLVVMVVASMIVLLLSLPGLFAAWNPLLVILLTVLYLPFSAAFLIALVRPMLRGWSFTSTRLPLRPSQEPLIYAYVEEICQLLGAPRPSAIYINSDLNAAAEVHRKWLGLFGTRSISLHLGMPLVAGLTIRQFSGVLAHEIGHFTQSLAMRGENWIRRIHQWFWNASTVVTMIGAGNSKHRQPKWVTMLLFAPTWLAQLVLRGFSSASDIISCLMSREMEFNADRFQVRVVGAKTLASTLIRIGELNVARQGSMRDISAFLAEGRLPDDIVALSVANAAMFTPQMKDKLRRIVEQRETGLFDTHPSDRDRIAAARIEETDGVFAATSPADQLPASSLFKQFRDLSKTVTEHFYRVSFAGKISPRMLHSVNDLLSRQLVELDAARALRRYFQTDIPRFRPLPLAPQSSDAPEDPSELQTHLKDSRARMLAELAEYQRLTPRYRTAEINQFAAQAAQILVAAQLPVDPAQYSLSSADHKTIADKLSRADKGIETLAGKLLAFESEAGNRLSFALQLAQFTDLAKTIPNGDVLVQSVRDYLPIAQFVSRLVGKLPALRQYHHQVIVLSTACGKDQLNEERGVMILNKLQLIRATMVGIQRDLGSHLYPFDHANAETTLREYALPAIPAESDFSGLIEVADRLQSRLVTVQMRLFARLAQIAEQVEAAIGMPPLSEPSLSEEM